MSSEPKVGPESDTDSMAEYGDGDTGTSCFYPFSMTYFHLYGTLVWRSYPLVVFKYFY